MCLCISVRTHTMLRLLLNLFLATFSVPHNHKHSCSASYKTFTYTSSAGTKRGSRRRIERHELRENAKNGAYECARLINLITTTKPTRTRKQFLIEFYAVFQSCRPFHFSLRAKIVYITMANCRYILYTNMFVCIFDRFMVVFAVRFT